ncbi:fumarylacetoacetate hydrolase family protein [Bradyrhizobium lablabi]|uniref:fumarylacetoacetate hydrolase family protein n=1 Tax=Bradyrhizobium lablabi TaxID=722472 RepID=UPI001BA5B27A|nr:fumarylacetoacetate hydrolase family protein [Bradyrhizobium lablabi]MBR1120504.1 fumarylacetoacetate hydrolase family protein [Bradyrhizobium lablabi]
MKIASFKAGSVASYGIVTDSGVIDAGRRLKDLPTLKALLTKGSVDALKVLTGERADYALKDIELLPTVPDPDKIFCIGVNYATHLAESGHPTPPHPMIFTRFANSQVGGGQPMIRPLESERFDYEGEMAVIVGRRGRRISRENALKHVAGYACYNDGSIRDWQRHTSQFAPGKNFAGTGGFGPWMVTTDEISDISKQTIATRLNGVEVQAAPISDLVFDVPALIAYCSTFTELVPGDVIVTGTTGGVGAYRTPPLWMKDGDVVEVEISGIGVLRNPVKDEVAASATRAA